MKTEEERRPVRIFGDDETIRWSTRAGQHIAWVAAKSLFTMDAVNGWTIKDLWQMADGDFVTITNRQVDLPPWFAFHPSELAGLASAQMMVRLEEGYTPPDEPLDAPNIWRAQAGERLVLVDEGRARPVLELLDLQSCALVLGENMEPSADITRWGGFWDGVPSQQAAQAIRTGFHAAVALGTAETFATEWRFGG